MWTDVSARGFGAVPEQRDGSGDPHPIAFASRQTQSKYAPTEPELVALVFGVEYFEVYLQGNHVTVYTDPSSPSFGQCQRITCKLVPSFSWIIPLMKLEYKPGRVDVVADSLSRVQEDLYAGEVKLVSNGNMEDPVLAKVQREQWQN